MKIIPVLITVAALGLSTAYAQEKKTYVGIVTDTMCKTSHAVMKVTPDEKCVRDCVGDGKTHKYALAQGNAVYTLSDQQTPAKFAGRKVKVTGVLYPKTNILKVGAIEPAK
jgi:hypothetical protein